MAYFSPRSHYILVYYYDYFLRYGSRGGRVGSYRASSRYPSGGRHVVGQCLL